MKDYYEILGVDKSADASEIKKAFHKLAQKYHPDKKGGDEAKFKEASEAYAVLSDKKKRAEYDAYGRTFAGGASGAQGGFGGFDFSQFQQGFGGNSVEFDLGDIFGDIFGAAQGGGRRQKRGRDISIDLELTFEEAAFGVKRSVLINKVSECDDCKGSGAEKSSQTVSCKECNGQGTIHETRRSILGTFTSQRECSKCHGSGKVPEKKCRNCGGEGVAKKQEELTIAIPAGIDDGEMIRLPGKGEAIAHGVAGDLYIKVHVQPHKTFTRHGHDIRMKLNIKLTDALLGSSYTIPTLEKPLTLKIPQGITHGEVLRVPKKGIPTAGGTRGDLLVTIHIDFPKKLSKSAKKIVEELKKEGI